MRSWELGDIHERRWLHREQQLVRAATVLDGSHPELVGTTNHAGWVVTTRAAADVDEAVV